MLTYDEVMNLSTADNTLQLNLLVNREHQTQLCNGTYELPRAHLTQHKHLYGFINTLLNSLIGALSTGLVLYIYFFLF